MGPRHKAMAVIALAVLTIAPKGCESLTEPSCLDLVFGCDRGGGGWKQSQTKVIEITTITTGEDIDPNGYSVRIEQGTTKWSRHVSANGSRRFSLEGSPGEHTVELGDVASNCVVSGNNPRVLWIAQSVNATRTTFEFQCTAISPGQP
jgi:hypothetical protein